MMIAPSRGIVTKNRLCAPVLIRASRTFPGLPLLRVSRNVVRAMITEAPIACQNHASVVAVFERAILTVPIHTTSVDLDHRAPRSIGALRLSGTEAHRCKSSGSHQNCACHHLSKLHAGLVITPRTLSLLPMRSPKMIAPSRGIVTKNRFGAGFNTGERYVSGSALAPIQRRSTGCDCRSRALLARWGSTLRTSDTGSSTHPVGPPSIPRTTEPRRH